METPSDRRDNGDDVA